jgi:UDP-GlcNAc:undecaprenyl-phosphate GlcNAc-1-phosphate transferase
MTHYAPMAAALVTMLLTFVLIQSKAGAQIQDVPNERSLHDTPVPRIGGVGLMAGVLSGWALMLTSLTWWLVLPMLLLFGVSLVDDMKGLPVAQRLAAHIGAAAVLVVGSGLLMHHPLIAAAVLFLAVWATNLYNFMDGADGVAGGMTLFGFSAYGVASLMHGLDTQAMINFSVAAAAIGFLYHNFPPAKVFMGDAGSIPLGFLAAGMGVLGWENGSWPVWFPVLVFSPFIVDATVTLIKRSLRRARVTAPHREHYYQRLVQMGWGHRNVAQVEYVLMVAAAGSAVWAVRHPATFPWALLLGWAGFYAIAMLVVDRLWRASRKGSA